MSIDAFAQRMAALTAVPLHALRFADSVGALVLGSRTREARTQATIHGDPHDPLTLDDIAAKYSALERALFEDAAASLTDAAALARTLQRLAVPP